VHNNIIENDRLSAGKNYATTRVVAPTWSGSQEMGKIPHIRRSSTSTRGGLVHNNKRFSFD